MLLELALFVMAFSLPLDLFRARFPWWPGMVPRRLAAPSPSTPRRRAPLAEHGWEDRVLNNLTQSE